jgi:hypothetical protein
MLEVRTFLTGPGVVGGGLNLTYWGGTTGGEAEAATDAMHTFWDDLNGALTNEVTFALDTVVNVVDPATGDVTGAIGPVTTFDPVQGTDGTHTLPLATQGLIHLRTGTYVAGREVRGRIFVPCFGEDMSEAGAPNAAAIGAMQTAINNLLGAIVGLKVFSRTHNVELAVISGQVSPKWAVLRSRRD